ncbi:MAG: GNAT family N-acetyltransferase [Phycisphaerae bacterium]|nr:GNAT family N-acetyltransferase [Phycisphaerae bacterium]
MTIRPARQDDAEGITELWKTMAKQHRRYDSSVWCWSDDAPVAWKRHLSDMIGNENVAVLVAEVDGELVGFAGACVNDNPDIFQIRKAGEIWDVFVRDDCRGHGVGKALMQATEQALADRGAEDSKLHVALHNPGAIEFYKALGYEPVMYRMYKRI